jgi:hypothetical protein
MHEPLEVQFLIVPLLAQSALTIGSDDRVGTWIGATLLGREPRVVGPTLLDELELFVQVGAVGVEDQAAFGILAVPLPKAGSKCSPNGMPRRMIRCILSRNCPRG